MSDAPLYDLSQGPGQGMLDLDLSQDIVGRRTKVYGDPVVTHVRIAHVWSGILGFNVQPSQVPLLMMGLKLVRASISPTYSDNSDDIEGYLDIFRKVVGDDMVHGYTAEEYQLLMQEQ